MKIFLLLCLLSVYLQSGGRVEAAPTPTDPDVVTFVNKVEADLAERYDLVYRFVADKAHLEYSVYKKELHEMIDDLQLVFSEEENKELNSAALSDKFRGNLRVAVFLLTHPEPNENEKFDDEMREMYENIDMNESGKYKRIIDHAKGNEFTVTNWKNEPRRMLRERGLPLKRLIDVFSLCGKEGTFEQGRTEFLTLSREVQNVFFTRATTKGKQYHH